MRQTKKTRISKFQHDISSSGSWCRNASGPGSSTHMTDFRLAAALESAFGGEGVTVGSFGDGPGVYKEYFDKRRAFRGILKVCLIVIFDNYPCGGSRQGK